MKQNVLPTSIFIDKVLACKGIGIHRHLISWSHHQNQNLILQPERVSLCKHKCFKRFNFREMN